jgi:hypothetical protein
MKMVRYLVLFAVFSMLLMSGCVVVNSEEHFAAACVKADAAPAALP